METSNKYDELEAKYKSILKLNYGFETPIGWYNILAEFLEQVTAFEGWFKIVQIKEKFGGLRIYIDTEDDIPEQIRAMIEGLISETEFKANRVCHDCGCNIDRNNTIKHRFYVLCNKCSVRKSEAQ